MLINLDQKPEVSQSKYELTLAEFPIFLLSKKGKKDIDCLTYEDTINGRDNLPVKRTWKVYPDAKHGFGTESTFKTLFDLFQLWKDQEFTSQFIHFGSVFNLIKQRGSTSDSNQNYNTVVRDLRCLVGMVIEAQNAFWDNERQGYVDMTFHLFDAVYIYKEKPTGQQALPFSIIKASDVLYGSIQKNSILATDFDSHFFHNLSPIEQRLAIYLSKMFRSQSVHKKELLKFAEIIPIYAKKTFHIKETVKNATQGLITKGYKLLEGVSFEKGIDGKTEMVIFRRKGKPYFKLPKNQETTGKGKDPKEIDLYVADILAVCGDEQSKNFYKKVARVMDRSDIYRALSEVKEIRDLGQISNSRGALFTSLIKKYAREQSIEL